jgi:hypothetical protein
MLFDDLESFLVIIIQTCFLSVKIGLFFIFFYFIILAKYLDRSYSQFVVGDESCS